MRYPRHTTPLSVWLGLSLAIAIAACLRFPGLSNGLPQMLDPDSVIVSQAVAMERNRIHDESKNVSALYPHFLPRVLDLLPGELTRPAPEGSSLEAHLAAAARPHLAVRWMIAILGCLAVPGVFLLARRFLEGPWAVLAALFMATSLLHVLLSKQARPHAALTAGVAWALLSILHMARRPSIPGMLLCGLGCSLALGVLHSGSAVLPAAALAGCFVLRDEGWRAAAKLLLVPLVILGMCLFAYPFLFTGDLWAGRQLAESAMTGAGFPRVVRSLWALDPTLLVLGTVALAVGAGRFVRDGERWRSQGGRSVCLLAVFALPYYASIGVFYQTWHRFVLPLVPVLAVMAAYGVRELASWAAARTSSAWAARVPLIVGLACVLFPLLTAARYTTLTVRPHSTSIASRWVEEHLDPAEHSIGISYKLNLPLAITGESARRTPKSQRSPWERYIHDREELGLEDEWTLLTLYLRDEMRAEHDRMQPWEVARRLRNLGATHALIVVPGERRATFDGAREAMGLVDAELLEVIEPYSSEHLHGTIGGQDQLGFEGVRVAWLAEGIGPAIEIYRLPAPAAGR